MIAEIGVFSLILALMFASLLAIIPLLGLRNGKTEWTKSAPIYAYGQFVFVGLAYCCLTLCFLRDDFSVLYVLTNSSTITTLVLQTLRRLGWA